MIKIFADGCDLEVIAEQSKNPIIKGWTTNPALMRKAGVVNYKEFALRATSLSNGLPISFEVFSDDFPEMLKQAQEISSWGTNVFVKIPITNTKGESSQYLIRNLNWYGIPINVTAITTIQQVQNTINILRHKKNVFISIFAGRIADTGVDPLPIMKKAVELVKGTQIEILWASPREVLNIKQAEDIGCHIITSTNDIIKKMSLFGKDLNEYSLETVKMFYNDAKAAGFKL